MYGEDPTQLILRRQAEKPALPDPGLNFEKERTKDKAVPVVTSEAERQAWLVCIDYYDEN